MSRKVILALIGGMFLFLFLVWGGFRSFIGSAAGGIFSLARDAFSQNEVLLGEIPLDNSSVDKSASLVGAVNLSSSSSVKAVNVVYSSGVETKLLNEKLKSLEDRIASLSAILETEISDESVETQTFSQNSSIPIISTADINPIGVGRVLVSEIMVGADASANYEFIELYNAGSAPVDLTGWVIKKKTSSGSETSLVASKLFSGKIIQPGRYLLLGNGSGYAGSTPLDISWASSNTLAYKNNSIVVYDADGYKLEEIGWDEIPKNGSLTRTGWDSNQFTLSVLPTPQNSLSI